MKDRALAYLRIKDIGHYALIPPVERPPLPPKNFLIRMTPEAIEEHKDKFKDAEAKCVVTATGAKFCLIKWNGNTLESMEMCRPIFEFKKIVEEKRPPTIEECRAAEKNDFLVIECEPKEICLP